MKQKTMGTWRIPEKYPYNTWIAQRTNALLAAISERIGKREMWMPKICGANKENCMKIPKIALGGKPCSARGGMETT